MPEHCLVYDCRGAFGTDFYLVPFYAPRVADSTAAVSYSDGLHDALILVPLDHDDRLDVLPFAQ